MLEQLRKIVRGTEEEDEARPRTDDPARLLFRPLEPFLVEGNFPVRPGQIRRASLLPVWQWLGPRRRARAGARIRGGAGRDAAERQQPPISKPPARKFQLAAADAIVKIATPVPGDDKQRALARVGPPNVIEDLLSIGCGAAGPRGAGYARQPASQPLRAFGDSADRLGRLGAQRSLAADAATAAVRAVAGDAAAGRAMADHSPRHQDGGLRR